MSVAAPPCARCGGPLAGGLDVVPTYPFCSPRCKLVDLSKWLSGSYRIAGEPVDTMDPTSSAPAARDADDDSSTPSA